MSTPTEAAGGLTPEQAEYLRAQQAAQAVQGSAGITSDSATVADQMTERGPLLPAEIGIEQVMEQFRQYSDLVQSMQGQINVLQRQQEEAQAAAGGPLTIRYAQGAADKISAYAAQWPAHDLSVAATAAADVLDAAKAVVKGDSSVVPKLTVAQAAIGRVFGKLPHVDSSAILDDVAQAVDEAHKLLAA